jgi:hypothetical protein
MVWPLGLLDRSCDDPAWRHAPPGEMVTSSTGGGVTRHPRRGAFGPSGNNLGKPGKPANLIRGARRRPQTTSTPSLARPNRSGRHLGTRRRSQPGTFTDAMVKERAVGDIQNGR